MCSFGHPFDRINLLHKESPMTSFFVAIRRDRSIQHLLEMLEAHKDSGGVITLPGDSQDPSFVPIHCMESRIAEFGFHRVVLFPGGTSRAHPLDAFYFPSNLVVWVADSKLAKSIGFL
jgi:hypothetical protein